MTKSSAVLILIDEAFVLYKEVWLLDLDKKKNALKKWAADNRKL